AERLQERGYRAAAAQRRNANGFERRLVVRICDGGEELGLERAKVGHRSSQLRQRNVLGSSGLTKARPSSCAAIHSSFTRIHQRACVSASLMSMSLGLCTRPSRCLITTWRSWSRKVCMKGLSNGASGATQPAEAQKIWWTSVASSVIGVIAVNPTTACRSPCTSSTRSPGSLYEISVSTWRPSSL